MKTRTAGKFQIVIIGAGFAGLSAAKRLARHPEVEVLLVDRNNYHTFQPLLYQVAAAELESEEIANPLRGLFRNNPRVSVAMLDVFGIDLEKRILHTNGPDIDYDYLIIAAGTESCFFSIPGADENVFTLKSLEDAVRLRNHLLRCFEKAALTPNNVDTIEQSGLAHVVVVGGGPTGVEYAGALAELIRIPLSKDFPELPKSFARITLLDACDDILPGFPQELRNYAKKRLTQMGVGVKVNAQVKEVTKDSVVLGDGTTIATTTVVWTAGVKGNEIAKNMGLPIGRGDRVSVLQTLQIADHPEIFVAGDLSLPEGINVPMVAPNAIQQGNHAAENIIRKLKGEELQPFSYHDKGSLATIGRNAAIARLGKHSFYGIFAWILWLVVHLSYLVGFHNRLMVMINWAADYIFFERSVRVIIPRTSNLKNIFGKNDTVF